MVYPTSNVFFVHGREGALKYPVGPGYTAYLFDLDDQKFYIKTNGEPLRECEYTEIIPVEPQAPDLSNFATKDDLAALTAEIRKLSESINNRNNYRKEKANDRQHNE